MSRVPLGADGQPGASELILDDDGRRRGALILPRAGGEAWLVEVLRAPAQLRIARYTPATNTVHATSTVDLPGDAGGLINHARGDLDGDGDLDLVMLTRGGAITLRQTPAGLERVGEALGPCYDAAGLGDLDGDGRLDLVLGAYIGGNPPGRVCDAVNPDGGGVTVMWGDGAFGFEPQPIGGLSFHVTVADLNGDGLDDIVHTVTDPLPLVGVFISKPGRDIAPYAPRELAGLVHGTATADLDGDGVLDVLINRELQAFRDGTNARGFVVWRRASPTTQRLEAGRPQQITVAPGATGQVALRSERRHLERVGLTLQLRAAAPVEAGLVTVQLTPPGGDPVAVAGLTADGARLRLHAADVVDAGWYPDGAWQVRVTNNSGQPLTVTDARVIAVGGRLRAVD